MATPVDSTVALTGNPYIDGLVQGSSWVFDAGSRTLTYSLSLYDVPAYGGSWTPTWQLAATNAFQTWANVANISFAQSGSGTVVSRSPADLAVALTSELGLIGALSLGVPPSPSLANQFLMGIGESRATYPRPEGDLFFDHTSPFLASLAPGGSGFEAFVHEIGHALGLKHPFDDGGSGRPTFYQLGIGQYDNNNWTIMSYGITGGPGHAATPMVLDILAIQHVYGPNMSYRLGNDTYVMQNGMKYAIWDAGGTDTLDASSVPGPVTLDLRPGAISYRGFPIAPTYDAVVGIAYGATIENAFGTPSNDLIYGNDAANVIDGGADGRDTLVGGSGSDLLNGGYGFDTAVIGASRASATVARVNGDVVITSVDGTDVLHGVERAQFTDQSLLLASNAHASGADFSGDGRADILWRSTGDAVALWTMAGTALTGAAVIANAGQYWTLSASGDFNADAKADILWRGESGEVALWTLNGFQLGGAGVIATASPYWSIAGSGDFNGDAKADILWRGEGGEVALWTVNGFQLASAGVVETASPYWTIAGIADFNGDQTDDILWRGGNSEVALWTMSGGRLSAGGVVNTTSMYWTIAGTADFSADGKADILWRGANGEVALWTMDGAQLASAQIAAAAGVAPLYWTIADAGDFNGDGRADILWRGDAGDLAEWTNIGTDFSAAVLAAAPSYDDWLIG